METSPALVSHCASDESVSGLGAFVIDRLVQVASFNYRRRRCTPVKLCVAAAKRKKQKRKKTKKEQQLLESASFSMSGDYFRAS